jgi:hypothetical protein
MNMKKRIIIIFFIMLLINTAFASSSIDQQQIINEEKQRCVKESQNCTIPIWPLGTEWTYQTSLSFEMNDENTDLSLYLSLNPLQVELIQDASVYLLQIDSPVSGSLSIDLEGFPRLSGNLKNTDLDGFLKIYKNNLTVKELDIDISGRLSINLVPINLNIDALITFDPGYSFFQFPFQVGDEWSVESTGFTITGEILLPGITKLFDSIPDEITMDYSLATLGKTANCTTYENISSSVGILPTYRISLEEQLECYYSSVVGNIVRIYLEDDESDVFDYELNANLRSTNYVMPGSPIVPEAPTGPNSGKPNQAYEYTAVTTDPESDDIYYCFDWGDGTLSDWIGPVASGQSINASKTWSERGSYAVTVKAKDVHGNQCPWSNPLPVTMPKNKNELIRTLLFDWLQDHFPMLNELLTFFLDGLPI